MIKYKKICNKCKKEKLTITFIFPTKTGKRLHVNLCGYCSMWMLGRLHASKKITFEDFKNYCAT